MIALGCDHGGYELKQDDDVLIVQFTGREEPIIMSGREITK